MGKSTHDKSLTHEEIWDDSALVQSWDEAVEEYKVLQIPTHVTFIWLTLLMPALSQHSC